LRTAHARHHKAIAKLAAADVELLETTNLEEVAQLDPFPSNPHPPAMTVDRAAAPCRASRFTLLI